MDEQIMNEQNFKQKLITSFNQIESGWIDGDSERPNEKTPDILNHSIKVAIEIKDDIKYKSAMPVETEQSVDTEQAIIMVSSVANSRQKSRQWKADLIDANKKFLNYPTYKTLLIIRSAIVDFNGIIANFIINESSTFWKNDDVSIREVGVILFMCSNGSYYYRENINPNVRRNRILEKQKLEELFGHEIKDLVESEQ